MSTTNHGGRAHRAINALATATILSFLLPGATAQAANDPAAPPTAETTGAGTPAVQPFPNSNTRIRSYLTSTFGVTGLLRAGVGAGLDQAKSAPPEWQAGARGFAQRFGSRFAMIAISGTTEYAVSELLRQDSRYHRCDCHAFFPRTFHALSSTLLARTRSGSTVPSVPALAGAYTGSFAAVNGWYPSRYNSSDAFRIGSMQLLFSAAGNLLREFIPGKH
jgi:hypothetical protein